MKHTAFLASNIRSRLSVRASAIALCTFSAAIVATPAHAAGTLAGTNIENTATATFDNGGGLSTIDSNTSIILVDELLNVSVDNNEGDIPTTPGAAENVQTYRIVNTGNGPEAFVLTANVGAGGDDFDPTLVRIVLDSNNNGVYDPGVDADYVTGSNTPSLAPDAGLSVFIITSTPGTVTDGDRAQVDLRAVAATGSGAPGTNFAGAGEGGGNAVVGATGADEQDGGFLAVSAAGVTLTKSAVILDPFGGSRPVPGATITYTLVATVAGSGAVTNLVIADPIPSGTDYIEESIRLGGVAKTDASDTDEANFTSNTVTVNAGNVPGGQSRTVTFQVEIQ